MILWLTGNSGVGKTTLGKILAKRRNAILLDGDRMRETISKGAGFTPADRTEHNIRVASLAKELDSQGFDVVVTVIAPFVATRKLIDKMITPLWIYLTNGNVKATKTRPYEAPTNSILSVNTEILTINDAIFEIENTLRELLNSK